MPAPTDQILMMLLPCLLARVADVVEMSKKYTGLSFSLVDLLESREQSRFFHGTRLSG